MLRLILEKIRTARYLQAYDTSGLLWRVIFDLLLSSLGMLTGSMFTLVLHISRDRPAQLGFYEWLILDVWLSHLPVLTLCCLLGYVVGGLYRVNCEERYRHRLVRVVKSVGMALFLFLFCIYAIPLTIPRSTMAAAWPAIFVLILASRLAHKWFAQQYRILPASTYNPDLAKIVQDLTILTQQQGWVPPEGLPARAAWPYFADDEVLSAAAVLRSGRVNQWTGKEVERFQEEFAAACGVRHVIALANGTVALELALRAYGIGPGDEVVVTPRTFIASASCAVLQGAHPVFAEVDRASQNMTVETIRAVLTPRTRAIIAVHLAGWPCEMDKIMALAKERGLIVIEDCAQAHGARFGERPVGTFGHAAAFSFCQDKIMTTGGEGGLLLTNDDAVWDAAWAFKDHGKSYDAVYHREHPPGFRWLHDSFGTNWRMTEMQAAIGRRQLRKLPQWVQARRANAAVLSERFAGLEALRVTLPGRNVIIPITNITPLSGPSG
jgi:dTDP-4-amino-4,6-dideoxygalactose transaminase